MRSSDLYLADMLTAIEKARRYSEDFPDVGTFREDEQALDAATDNLQIIGEAATKLP